ncbi:MAG: glycosyltransferase family 4 protein [Prevotella sp.]|nr:glycosyltransferase family 4 protein [Prevotella sp.]
MKKLRILYVTHSEALQGANMALLEMVLELRNRQLVEPIILMPKVAPGYQKNNLYSACKKYQIECHSYSFYRFNNTKRFASYLRCLTNLLCYPYIFWKMKGQYFDLIHSNGSVVSLGAYLSRIKKVPHVWHFREAAALHYGSISLPGKQYEKWVYSRGDAYIAISNALKTYCAGFLNVEKLKMIYDGINSKEGKGLAMHNGNVLQLCMVGLIHPPKNQLLALEAIDIIVNEWGLRNVHITFIGYEERVYMERLNAFIKQKNIEKYVTFLGERNDVAQQLIGMDVGLMLSNFEAFGRVTVEYMLHGLAVIATETGANPELVDNNTGLLCQLGDSRQLATHIRYLYENRGKLIDFSKNGHAKVINLFSTEKNATQVYEVYLSLLKVR